MKNWGQKTWFAIMTVFAFLSFISFIQIDSYAADVFNLNAMWIIFGIVSAGLAIVSLVNVIKNSGGNTGYN